MPSRLGVLRIPSDETISVQAVNSSPEKIEQWKIQSEISSEVKEECNIGS